jgi:hypothetical protein
MVERYGSHAPRDFADAAVATLERAETVSVPAAGAALAEGA